MEASRGKGLSNRGSAARGLAAVGKENICPALSSKENSSTSRSPLPEGFPRAPLQDITHILSPINILPNRDGVVATELGQCRRGRKRSNCGAETHTSICSTRSDQCELSSSSEAWRGLRKCVTLQATNSHVQFPGKSKLTEVVEIENLAHLAESPELLEEAKITHAVEVQEEPLLCRETRDMEVLKTDAAETSSPLKTKPKRSVRLSASTPATRASLRSSLEKQKMSSLMKFR